MRSGFLVVLVGLVALLPGAAYGIGGAEHRGAGVPPPRPVDYAPAWSADGKRVVFSSFRLDGLASVAADGTDERVIVRGWWLSTLSPDGQWITYIGPGAGLSTARADGTGTPRSLGTFGMPVWSPDSRRIAVTYSDGLWVVDRDGGGLVQLAAAGPAYPSWSPDGEWIVFRSRPAQTADLLIVSSSGGVPRHLVDAAGVPLWSPDGTLIAYHGSSGLSVVRPDGSGRREFPAAKVVGDSGIGFAWMPDSRRLVFASANGLALLDVTNGTVVGVYPRGESPVPSPDGSRIAFAGQTCLGRQGILVVRVDGSDFRRLTNDCNIVGTTGRDVLRGTPWADVIFGLGGDDLLYALSSWGRDSVYGGPGNDLLVGTRGADDWMQGGPGNDELQGDSERDRLYGGPGRDRIFGGQGGDRIYTRDGERDVVVCGNGGWGRDRVWADRRDFVSRDCEIVHRPGRRA